MRGRQYSNLSGQSKRISAVSTATPSCILIRACLSMSTRHRRKAGSIRSRRAEHASFMAIPLAIRDGNERASAGADRLCRPTRWRRWPGGRDGELPVLLLECREPFRRPGRRPKDPRRSRVRQLVRSRQAGAERRNSTTCATSCFLSTTARARTSSRWLNWNRRRSAELLRLAHERLERADKSESEIQECPLRDPFPPVGTSPPPSSHDFPSKKAEPSCWRNGIAFWRGE